MERRAYQVVFPAILVVLMVAFLSTIFFAKANLSFAASSEKKSSGIARTSAVEHAEARIKELQDALKITETQKESWNKVTQVMRENAKEMDALRKDRAAITNMNAVEHMKFYSQMTEAHFAQLQKLIPPFEAFYAGLSDAQKKSADAIFRTGRHGKHKTK